MHTALCELYLVGDDLTEISLSKYTDLNIGGEVATKLGVPW